jgi:hypothetical protein
MRNIENEYLMKMDSSKMHSKQLIMTLQSFNRLNMFAI